MATKLDSASLSVATQKESSTLSKKLRFDWLMLTVSCWLLGGLVLDGWAHSHLARLETFFTPWHAVLYSGFLAVAIFLFGGVYRRHAHGGSWREAIPAGYELSLAGVVIFAVGGVCDMLWHILFGIEQNFNIVLSPTHLILALGFSLILTGPYRASWQRRTTSASPSWKKLFPMLLSMTFLLTIFTYFTIYANPFVNAWAVVPATYGSRNALSPSLGVASILLQSAILMGITLLTIRRWRLPFGALTFVFTLNSVLMTVISNHYLLIPPAIIAGLVGDVLLLRLSPSPTHSIAFRVFAFVVPLTFYFCYFIDLQLTYGIKWTIHFWMGSMVLAGVVGVLLSYLLLPPAIPQER